MIGKPSSLKCLMAFFLLLFCTSLIAQERVVTGKIKDPSGNPLPGVNVNVWGTRVSVTADVAGTFRIPVSSDNSVLVFTFVGFLQKEVKVGTETEISVAMTYDNADLDQVVIVGYGTSKRRDLTGSVYSIKPGMVTATPVANAAEALQGRIPGLDITRSSGTPGGGVNIQLRGNRTLSGNDDKGGVPGSTSAPLVIIDGFQGGSISDINPNDIESVEVLKDASSTAIYGWMGANGVIIVTTKRGKDRPKVSYNGYYGFNKVHYPKARMGQQYLDFRKDAYIGAGLSASTNESVLPDPDERNFYLNNQWIDWLDVATRNGIEQSHTASIQSGGDKTKVFFSTGIYREEGVLRGTDNTRYNARLNYDQRISNMFKAGFMTQLTYSNLNRRTDPMSQITQMSPLGQVYDDKGSIRPFPGLRTDTVYNPKLKNLLSPITDDRPGAYKDNTARGNIIANGYVEVTPITGLSLKTSLGTTLSYSRRGEYYDSLSIDAYNDGVGATAKVTNNFTRFYSWENVVTYNKKIADHNFTLTGLTSYTRQDADASVAGGTRLALTNNEFYYLNGTQATGRTTESSYEKTTTFSYAGRLNYTFKGKYLLQATMRADGVSRLSPSNKWDYFPSAGLGWNIHQEDFMKDLWFVNNLKIRATYGVAGNASIAAYSTQSVLSMGNATLGNTSVVVANFKDLVGNTSLGWEKSATVNLGLDFALFKSRIFGTIDAYQTKTTDILYKRPLPTSSGFSYQWQNVGESENKGIEVALSSVNVNNRDFKWSSTITFTAAKEKITRLITNEDILGSSRETQSLLVGHPVKSWYGYTKLGIWQTNENKDLQQRVGSHIYDEGDIKVLDVDGNNVIETKLDEGFQGADVPKWFGGFQNTFTYKGLELSVYMVARYGQIINAEFMAGRFNVDGTGNGIADFNYWRPDNPTNDFPRPRTNAKYSNAEYTGYYSMNFIDGSFVKLKTATLAYTLPSQISRKAFADKIRLYVTGNNILTKTKNKYLKNYDPERGGSENGPITRSFVVGANIDF